MSDFLDRLATRAIGGEGLLMPRLPSLFEPPAGAPVMPPAAEAADAPPRHALMSPVVEASGGKQDRPAPPAAVAATMAPASSRPVRSPERLPAAASVASPAAPAPMMGRRPPPIDRPHSQPRSRGRSSAIPPSAVAPPSETHVATGDPIVSSLHAQRGALLPPASPVFASSHDTTPTPRRSGSPGTTRAHATLAAQRDATAAEPVIHVSIGRLEVRASPGSAAPPRRRDEPRPDSLDDYLRQRGRALP
jgi:hypothetical protein